MKKFYFLTAVLFIFSLSFVSCQKDDLLEPGIVYTDTPPESLFNNSGYASTQKVWIEGISQSKKIKGNDNVCDQNYNEYTGNTEYFDCGVWRLVPARKFWGIKGGIIYLSNSIDWYIVRPSDYLFLFEEITKRETIIGYLWIGAQNPFGISNQRIGGFE